ncbi:hypothetical protein ACWGI8_13300 [Streptomyces sp. NPDC054841]
MPISASILTAAAAGLLLLTGCGQSYDELADGRYDALKERPGNETGKPAACQDLRKTTTTP